MTTGAWLWSLGWANTWAYHPGLRTPAPYPLAVASRRWLHGTQLSPTLTFGRPRRRPSPAATGRPRQPAQGRHVPRPAHHRYHLARGQQRVQGLADARLAAGLGGTGQTPGAHRCHRLGDRADQTQTRSVVLDDVVPPPLRIGVTGRSGEQSDRVRSGLAIEDRAPPSRRPASW